MAIYVDLNNEKTPSTRQALNKYYSGDVPSTEEVTPSSDTTNTVDDLIAKNNFITPAEYYSTQSTGTHGSTDKTKEGYYNITGGGNNNVKINWFWCEDIKNWCSYIVFSKLAGNGVNQFILQVWNGKDGWITIPNLYLAGDPISKAQDKYGIADIQEYFLAKARDGVTSIEDGVNGVGKNIITQARGVVQDVFLTADNSRVAINSKAYNRLHHVVGLRLQKSIKYSINDSNNFQTIRWNTLYSPLPESQMSKIGNFAQGNFRVPITKGIPPVWRLPTGEICLASFFSYCSDGGPGYVYVKTGAGELFRKHPLGNTKAQQFAACDKILGDDEYEGASWLNSICANFFGNGNDKTIANDWLHESKINSDTSEYTAASYNNMLDSSKVFEQHNINKENSLKCSFTVNRPVVTTEEITTSDYAKKW